MCPNTNPTQGIAYGLKPKWLTKYLKKKFDMKSSSMQATSLSIKGIRRKLRNDATVSPSVLIRVTHIDSKQWTQNNTPN